MQGPKFSDSEMATCLHTKTPCDLHSKMPSELSFETKLSRALFLSARSLVVLLSGCKAHSSGECLQNSPALTSTPAGLIQRDDTTHTGAESSPRQGAVTGHTHTRSRQCTASRFLPKGVFTTIQADTTFKSHATTTNLIH